MDKKLLDNLAKSEFLNLADESPSRDNNKTYQVNSGCIGLPPGCDCICNQPCDFTTPGCYRL